VSIWQVPSGFSGSWIVIGGGGGGKSYSAAQTQGEAEQKAAARGLEVKTPRPNELFIDIDNARDFARFKTLIEMFSRVEDVMTWADTPSASGGQHRHVVVSLGREVTAFERIAFQAMLGSDLKREVLSYERAKTGSSHPTIFFEPKAGVKPVAKKTGFNCKTCNFKNDFAEANQDDGTYVCFNCRVEE
jgi:hypothetical protein